jgi:hypothetical protein
VWLEENLRSFMFKKFYFSVFVLILNSCSGSLSETAVVGDGGVDTDSSVSDGSVRYCGHVLSGKDRPRDVVLLPPEFGAPSLQPGQGPDTSTLCVKPSHALPGPSPDPDVIRTCYGSKTEGPQATLERVFESVSDSDYIHFRLTFNPNFVDNTYGVNSVGWQFSNKGTHTFKDLVDSDHAEIILNDSTGKKTLHFKLDYISLTPSGYYNLGVLGGDGSMIFGDSKYILETVTSLERNLNYCGYGKYTVDSPKTDNKFSPNPEAPNWDYRVVYEFWVDTQAFSPSTFGKAFINYVHASPSKWSNSTILVEDVPCPPNTDGGTPNTDGGTPNTDGGTPNTDGGTPNTDGGTPNTDGGTPNTDGGKPPVDCVDPEYNPPH